MVQSFLSAKLASGLAWKTVKHLRTVFGTVMGAAEMAELIPANPVRKTRLPGEGKSRHRTREDSGTARSSTGAVQIAGLAAGAHGAADRGTAGAMLAEC